MLKENESPSNTLYLVVMENTFKNNIHANQIYPVLNANPNMHALFINPLFEASRSRIGLVKGRQKIDHAKVFYSPFPTYFFFSQWFVLPFVILWSCVPLLYLCVKNKIAVIHARNLMSGICAVLVSKICDVSVVMDMRGVHPDEGVIIGRWKYGGYSYRIHKRLEAWVLKAATHVACISPNLCKYVSDVAPSVRPIFVPAMVSPESFYFSAALRKEARNQLSIKDNDVCLIYTGSLGSWHRISELKKQISDERNLVVGKKLVVIILSNADPDVIKSELDLDISIPIIVRNVPPVEVNYYLNAADIGLLPAKKIENESDRIVFDVMISSKAEEYLSTGLDIRANPAISFFFDDEYYRSDFKSRDETAFFYQSKFSNASVIEKIRGLHANAR
jgi:hypothetical protein